MNANQNAFFKMVSTLILVCNRYTAVWNNTPSFKVPFMKLITDVMNLLPQAQAQQGQKSTGVTLTKEALRTVLETQLLTIAGGVEAYAATIKDLILRKNAHLAPSDLRQMSDRSIVGEAGRIVALATANVANLGPYNVTAASIAGLQTSANQYSGWIGRPKVTIEDRKGGTDGIARLVTTAADFLDTMDAQMVLFQTTGPDFYQQYFFARAIDDAPTRTRAITFTVKDAQGLPVPDAMVNMGGLPKAKRTGPKGICYVQNMAPGSYNGKVEKGGYVPQPFTAVVNAGETAKVDVVLVKA